MEKSIAIAGSSDHQCRVTEPKKAAKKGGISTRNDEIRLDFSAAAKEFFNFNHFWVERSNDFLTLYLGYLEPSGHLTPIFRGMMWLTDFREQQKDLENYIVRIGSPKADAPDPKHPTYNLPTKAVPINSLGCASRQSWGELAIMQFSHKAVVDIQRRMTDVTTVTGVTHGCYISDIETHKRVIFELISAATTS